MRDMRVFEKVRVTVGSLAGVLVIALPALGQCQGHWLSGEGSPSISGYARAMIRLDNQRVMLGGDITCAGRTVSRGVIVYDIPSNAFIGVEDGHLGIVPYGLYSGSGVVGLTRCDDGTVLVWGTFLHINPSGVRGLERYDPRDQRWLPVSPHLGTVCDVARYTDGRYLLAGSFQDPVHTEHYYQLALYEPQTDEWTEFPADLLYPFGGLSTIAVRPNGDVVAGLQLSGFSANPPNCVKVLRPGTQTWEDLGQGLDADPDYYVVFAGVRGLTIVPGGTPDGDVIAWGAFASPQSDAPLRGFVRYDAVQDRWVSVAPGVIGSEVGFAKKLPDGRILAVGNFARLIDGQSETIAGIEYDPVSQTVTIIQDRPVPALFVALDDGSALAWNTYANHGVGQTGLVSGNIETSSWNPVSDPAYHSVVDAAELPDGTVLCVGQFVEPTRNVAEYAGLYEPDTGRWTYLPLPIGMQPPTRLDLLPNGDVFSGISRLPNASMVIWRFRPSTRQWLSTPLPPSWTYSLAVATPDGKILAMRTTTSGHPVNEIGVLNAESGAWSTLGAYSSSYVPFLLPGPNGDIAVVSSQAVLNGVDLGKVAIRSGATGLWSSVPLPQQALVDTYSGCFLQNGDLLVRGYYLDPQQPMAKIYRFNRQSENWHGYAPFGQDDLLPVADSFRLLPDGDVLAYGAAGLNTTSVSLKVIKLHVNTDTWTVESGNLSASVGRITPLSNGDLFICNSNIVGDQVSYGFARWSTSCHDPCDPDPNRDGVSDQNDVDFLINVIAGGDNPSGVDPDFNHDGAADQGDVDALVNVIAGGECP